MAPENQTQFTEFILLLFSEKPSQEGMLFGLFLSMYLVTMVGNLLIILAVVTDSHLHTPTYILLANLSLVDACVVTTTVPMMLESFSTLKAIPYTNGLTQMFFFIVFGSLDDFLLTAMAYDRFVAICHPLHYVVLMSSWFCGLLVTLCWSVALLNAFIHSLMVITCLSFCTNQQVHHFFCDLPEIMKLSCSDTHINYIVLYFLWGLLGFIPLMGIIYSYIQIASSIIKIPSAQGKYKAFSTCGSHLCAVSLFYGTIMGVYGISSFTHSSQKSTVVSAIYAVVTPMLNPFIYTLRNKDIKAALRRLMSRKLSSQ